MTFTCPDQIREVHNLLILSKLGIHCGKPSVYLILDFLLEVSIKLYSI